MTQVEKVDGKELFRELLSVYPKAWYEDYWKVGAWQVDLIKIDLELINCHRKEAGAPEPIPIEDVVMPTLPAVAPPRPMPGASIAKPAAAPGVSLPKPAPALHRIAPGVVAKPGVMSPAAQLIKKPLIKPVIKVAGIATPAGPAAGLTMQNSFSSPMLTSGNFAGAGAAAVAAGGPSAELRQIALFIQRWKLEAAKAKLLLARLTPVKRRWVMSNFKGTGTLEQYIQQCDRTMAWDQASAAGAAGGPLAAAKPMAPKPVAAKPVAAKPAAAKPVAPLRPAPKLITAPKPAGPKPVAPKPMGPKPGAPTAAAAGLKRPLGAPAAAVASKQPKFSGAYGQGNAYGQGSGFHGAHIGGGQGAAKAAPKPQAAASQWSPARQATSSAATHSGYGASASQHSGGYGASGATASGGYGAGGGYNAGGSYGSNSGGYNRPAAKPAAPKPVAARPAAAKPAASYSSGKGAYGSQHNAAQHGPQHGPKAGAVARPSPVGAKPGGYLRPGAAKPGPPKAKAGGSLIRSLLKNS